MRHDLRLATSRSAISLLRPGFSPYRPPLLRSRNLFSFFNLFNRRKNKESPIQSPAKDQVPPSTPENFEVSRANQPESLPFGEAKDTATLIQETLEGLTPASLQEGSSHVKESPESLTPANSLPYLTFKSTKPCSPITYRPASENLNPIKVKRRAYREKWEASENQKLRWTGLDPHFPERTWTIIDPVFPLEQYRQRTVSGYKMPSAIQFITTPTSDTPGTALVLQFDDKRYIIGNAHEGLQRASLQIGAKIFRTKDLFLTGRTEWQSIGGLLGMILTLADATKASAASREEAARLKRENKRKRGEEEGQSPKKDAKLYASKEDSTVRLHGGPNLTHTLATARSFIFRKVSPIKIFEHTSEREAPSNVERDWEPTWSDPRIQVWAMPIDPSRAPELDEDPKIKSPLKRSLGEFVKRDRPSRQEFPDQWSVPQIPPEGRETWDQQIRELAVSEMFSSAWSPHNMVETPLRGVKEPTVMFVRDDVTKALRRYEGPTPAGTAPVPDINVLVRRPWPGALIDHLPPTKKSSTAVSYIIRNHKMRGKFLPAAAKERNVPAGPLWAALASGSSVQSSDGVTVTPDMVMEPSKEGCGVAVIDLPSCEYVQNLVDRSEWKSEKVMSGVRAVIWILGPGVTQDKTLLEFIEVHPELQHIVSSPEQCPNYLSITSAASMAIRHNQVDPTRYAVPVHSNAVPSTSGNSSAESLFKICRPAKRGLRLELEPRFEISEETVVPFLNTALVSEEVSQDVLKLSQAAREEINSPATQAETLSQNLPSPDAEIICLGTGSAMASQHRNVSATLLRVPGCGSYLMDCGENTLGQLKRIYTAPQLAEVLRDLKLIWISHLHADHHLGLTSVIKAWYEEVHGKDEGKQRRPTIMQQVSDPARLLEDGKRLFVVGHTLLRRWLEEYSSVEDFGYDQVVPLVSYPVDIRHDIDASILEWNRTDVGFNGSTEPRIKSAIRTATGLSNLVSCWVAHCYGSQAVSLTFPTGFKFSYSGDCRPSKSFAEIGKDSTVLLHEATFDDDLKGDAKAKKHSTTSEAIGVGVAMRARRVILTHFSQRYTKIASMSALDPRSVTLEDAEDVDDPSAGMDQPVDESTSLVNAQATIDEPVGRLDDEPSQVHTEAQPQMQDDPSAGMDQPVDESTSPVNTQATIDEPVGRLDEEPSQIHAEPQPQMQSFQQTSAPMLPSACPANTAAEIMTPNDNHTPRPQLNDMKIGVAFDYMRVKVRDIMHLEKFTPALQELYKDPPAEAPDSKAENEDLLDDVENAVRRKKQVEKARDGQVKAARNRQGRKEKRMREEGEKGEKEREKEKGKEMEKERNGSGEGVVEEGVVEERAIEEGAMEGVVEEGTREEGVVEGAIEERVMEEGAMEEGVVEKGVVEEGAMDGVVEEGAIEEKAMDEGAIEKGAREEGVLEGAIEKEVAEKEVAEEGAMEEVAEEVPREKMSAVQ